MNNKNKWVEELKADELKNALYEVLEENNNLRKAFLSGNTKSSIALSNLKDGTKIGVKAYSEDINKATEKATKAYDELKKRYNNV